MKLRPRKRTRKNDDDDDENDDNVDVTEILRAIILAMFKRQPGEKSSDDEEDDDEEDEEEDDEEEDETWLPHKRNRSATRRRNATKHNNYPAPPLVPSTLSQLIELARLCQKTNYRDCDALGSMHNVLCELDHMVGLLEIKQTIVDFVLLHLQRQSMSIPAMNHIILAGPPGCGKTTLCTILAKILCRLGLCSTEKIVFGTQANMIAGYLGQTAAKTEAIIRSAFGGVLVIDEASSLSDGRGEGSSDSFSKSCIDTLNRMLSEYGHKFICILAGYKHEIHRDILSLNPGMARRFSTQFEVQPYRPIDLRDITLRQFSKRGVQIEPDVVPPVCWFREHIQSFPNYGGDCEILVEKTIIVHSKTTFGQKDKDNITRESVLGGFELMMKARSTKPTQRIPYGLYI